MKFAKFQRVPFLQNTSGRLLLEINLSSQKNNNQITKFAEFLFEKAITYTIIVLLQKIFKSLSGSFHGTSPNGCQVKNFKFFQISAMVLIH